MQLNLTTDYAIRFALQLAALHRPAGGAEIAGVMCIPERSVSEISRKLRKAGIITAVRGTNGGYALAKPAEEISLGEIVNAMEGTTRINRCLEPDHYCNRGAADTCPVRRFYQVQQDDMDQRFYAKTIAMLIDESKQ